METYSSTSVTHLNYSVSGTWFLYVSELFSHMLARSYILPHTSTQPNTADRNLQFCMKLLIEVDFISDLFLAPFKPNILITIDW